MILPAHRMSQLGTETAFEVLARAEALAGQGRDIINLGIGQPDFKTPPHIVEKLVEIRTRTFGLAKLVERHHQIPPTAKWPVV